MDTHTAPETLGTPHSTLRAWLALGGLSLAALGLSQEAPPDPLLRSLYELLARESLAPFGSGIGAAIGALGLIFALVLAFLLGFGLRDAFKRRKARSAARKFAEGRNSVAGTLALVLVAIALFLGLRYGFAYLSELREEAAMEGTHTEAPPPLQGPVPGAEAPALEEGAEPSAFFARLTFIAFLGGISLFLARLAYRRLRLAEPGPASDGRSGDEALARGLALARERLHVADRDADAIIGCYADMCELFQQGSAAAEKPLSAALTAREFEALLRARGAGEGHIHELTLLFEKARYSGLACDAQDRRRASAALSALERRYSKADVSIAAAPAPAAGAGAGGPGDKAHG